MVTVRVGQDPDHKDFTAHESFLTARSEFFRRAMNGKWAESDTRMVKLPDDEPETFTIYLNLVYTGQLVTMRKSKEELATMDIGPFMRETENEYCDLFDLYVLAEKLQDVLAKNAAITAAIDVSIMESADASCTVPSFAAVNSVYEGTPEGSPARRVVADLYSTLPLHCIFTRLQSNLWHKDLVADVLKILEVTRPIRKGSDGNVAARKGAKAYQEIV
jgi:hypothetical protein